jgi:flavin-dependent dehydrogenase
MSNKIYDCAIVGGGLAGLTLAIQLASSRHSVILFEKEKYPFHKVCGEYVSMESFNFLQTFGLQLFAMELPEIDEVLVSAPNGSSITRKLDMGGFGVSRYTLDAALAKIALKKGVTLMEGTTVFDESFRDDIFTINATGETFYARVLCGTYGKRGNLDRTLDRKFERENHSKNYLAVKYHVKVNRPASLIELHNFKGGYCGISKVDEGKHCLCYLTDADNLKENNNSIKQLEENVVKQNPFLKRYFSEAVFLNENPYAVSNITFDKKTAVEKHVLMAGDSAGTIAPLCGNGMSMAMHASYIGYLLIDRFLKKDITRDKMEAEYELRWNKLFSKRIKAGKYLQGLFGKKNLTNTTIGILKHLPRVTDSLIEMTHGEKF